MTNWQRFGDDTWVNVDHVEVVRVEEQEDGGWQLVAAFASGQTHPLGGHADRDLLVECTDVLLRGEVGEHLLALTDPVEETATVETVDPQPAPAKRRRWWFRRPEGGLPVNVTEAHPDVVQAPAH